MCNAVFTTMLTAARGRPQTGGMRTSVVRNESGHIAGKQRRRRAILDAARRIVITDGEAGLTMRAIASEAGVALVTPYNLFGSKQGVLQAMCEEQLEQVFAASPAWTGDAGIRRLFDLIDFNFGEFQQDPDFYRAFWDILYGKTGIEIEASVWEPRNVMMQGLLRSAITAGDVREDAAIEQLARNLMRLFRAVTLEWVDGLITLDDAHRETGMAFVSLVRGAAEEGAHDVLREIEQRYTDQRSGVSG